MKVVITSMIWKRPEIFKIWSISICRLINSFPGVEFKVLVAGSEKEISRKQVEFYGFDYVEAPNDPLGNKANLRLQACKKYGADYILFLGSDDILNNKAFAFILDKMEKGFEEIAPIDLYIYDSESRRLIYSKGYTNERKGERLAIGRAIKTDVLNKVSWNLWRPGINKSLDGSSRKILDKYINNPFYYYLKDNDLMIIDIKSEVNLSPFKIRSNHTLINSNKLKQMEEHNLIINL